MVINLGSRRRHSRHLRVVAALLIALTVGMPLDLGPAAASPAHDLPVSAQVSADQLAPGQGASDKQPPVPRSPARLSPSNVSIRAKSSFEQTFNPFGDEWALKVASNTSVPIGLTPACYRQPGKPDAAESQFLAFSNSPLIFSECADIPDVSVPDGLGRVGSPQLKLVIEAVKALNPAVRYIGYFQAPRADTFLAGNDGVTVGVTFIDQNREDWFVHIDGQSPTRANRVTYSNGISHLFDVTNPDFRQYMVNGIVASMVHHGLDGFVLSDCLDLPFNSPTTPVPQAIRANWEAGCDALMQSTKAALEPLGKLVFTFGYDHIGTRDQGGAANDAAAFAMFQRRMEITHGLFWEDPFRAVTASDVSAESSFERYKRLRDYAVPRGRYLIHSVNTREGDQSTFATTDAGQQKALARYYLASFLAAMSGTLTVMHHYFPTALGEQFISNAYFREWDLRVGDALGADTKPAASVYQREFRNARVVANLSSAPFTVSLADGNFTDADGQAAGTNAVVPAKSGAVFMRVVRQVACTPRPAVRVSTALIGAGQMRVTVSAGGTGAAGNNILLSIRFSAADNGLIDAGSQSGSLGNFTLTLPNDTEQTSFVIRRAASGRATTVRFVVTDGCGDWPSFAGMGTGVP